MIVLDDVDRMLMDAWGFVRFQDDDTWIDKKRRPHLTMAACMRPFLPETIEAAATAVNADDEALRMMKLSGVDEVIDSFSWRDAGGEVRFTQVEQIRRAKNARIALGDPIPDPTPPPVLRHLTAQDKEKIKSIGFVRAIHDGCWEGCHGLAHPTEWETCRVELEMERRRAEAVTRKRGGR